MTAAILAIKISVCINYHNIEYLLADQSQSFPNVSGKIHVIEQAFCRQCVDSIFHIESMRRLRFCSLFQNFCRTIKTSREGRDDDLTDLYKHS